MRSNIPSGVAFGNRRTKQLGLTCPLVYVAPPTPPFTPASLPNLLRWYDAADNATLTIVNTNEVTAMQDKSGNAAHMTTASATNPTLVASGIVGLSAQSINFAANQEMGAVSLATLGSAATVYIVCSPSANQATDLNILLQNGPRTGAGAVGVIAGRSATGAVAGVKGPVTEYWAANNGNTTPVGLLVVIIKSSATARSARINGSAVGVTTSASAFGTGDFSRISSTGASNCLSAVGEIVVYTAIHDAGQIAQMEAYLNAKWFAPD